MFRQAPPPPIEVEPPPLQSPWRRLAAVGALAAVAASGALGATRSALSNLAPSLEPAPPTGLDRSFLEAIVAGAVGLVAGIVVGVVGTNAIIPNDSAGAVVAVYVSTLTSLICALCASYGWSRLRASLLRRR